VELRAGGTATEGLRRGSFQLLAGGSGACAGTDGHRPPGQIMRQRAGGARKGSRARRGALGEPAWGAHHRRESIEGGRGGRSGR